MRQLSAGRISIACPVAFLKQNNRVSEALSFSVKTSTGRCAGCSLRVFAFRIRYQSQPKRTCKRPKSRLNGSGLGGATMRSRWSLAIAGLILILAGGWLAHLTQTSGGIRIQDVRFAGAKGNIMSALLYIPPTTAWPRPGIPRFTATSTRGRRGRICHQPAAARGARPRSDRPWLQRSAGLAV
jgi:hypothetical protein